MKNTRVAWTGHEEDEINEKIEEVEQEGYRLTDIKSVRSLDGCDKILLVFNPVFDKTIGGSDG